MTLGLTASQMADQEEARRCFDHLLENIKHRLEKARDHDAKEEGEGAGNQLTSG